jgi:hypothetical protein
VEDCTPFEYGFDNLLGDGDDVVVLDAGSPPSPRAWADFNRLITGTAPPSSRRSQAFLPLNGLVREFLRDFFGLIAA